MTLIYCSVAYQSMLLLVLNLLPNDIPQVKALPVDVNVVHHDFQQLEEGYGFLKRALIDELGYTKEFADLVEINLKKAVREEIERQKQQGIVVPLRLRQGNQQPSDEDDDDEPTTPPPPTTPGASPGDVVRGIAGIVTSLGTFNVRNFWASFVNFFPPNQRESAQALVDASTGRRPARWPTLPTTTTKLTTTTKDEDEIDSEETTKASATAVTSSSFITATQAGSAAIAATPTTILAGVTPVVVENVSASSVTRLPTTKYTLIKRRTGTEYPDIVGLRVDENLSVKGGSFTLGASASTTTPYLV